MPKQYDRFKEMMEHALPEDIQLYAYYHGLMVEHTLQLCNKKTKCQDCPLTDYCPQLFE